jgi:aminoglycoside phosphotransferase (APT) family kinase protein
MLMDFVAGRVIATAADAQRLSASAADQACAAFIDTLARLHSVDVDRAGLSELGRPHGYLIRQVRRWAAQWETTKTRPLPEFDELARWVGQRVQTVPADLPWALVHGDFRLDNLILAPVESTVLAVLDWEMSTLGDPLADLGLLLVYWQPAGGAAAVVPSVTGLPGFPARSEVVARYAARTGRDVDALPWYVAFGYFKLAVVVAGIVVRQRAGAMADNTDDGLGDAIGPLAEAGRDALTRRADDLD